MLDKLKAYMKDIWRLNNLSLRQKRMNDMKLYVQMNKEYKDLGPIVKAFHEYKNVVSNIDSSKQF